MAAAGFWSEFIGGVKGGIYLPSQFPCGLFKQGGQLDHFDGTNDEQVNVAGGTFRAAGHRAINRRHFDLGGQRGQVQHEGDLPNRTF